MCIVRGAMRFIYTMQYFLDILYIRILMPYNIYIIDNIVEATEYGVYGIYRMYRVYVLDEPLGRLRHDCARRFLNAQGRRA